MAGPAPAPRGLASASARRGEEEGSRREERSQPWAPHVSHTALTPPGPVWISDGPHPRGTRTSALTSLGLALPRWISGDVLLRVRFPLLKAYSSSSSGQTTFSLLGSVFLRKAYSV